MMTTLQELDRSPRHDGHSRKSDERGKLSLDVTRARVRLARLPTVQARHERREAESTLAGLVYLDNLATQPCERTSTRLAATLDDCETS